MRKLLLVAVALLSFAVPASAGCFGTGSFRTCTDNSGNTYTTTRVGNQSFTTGSNARTGSTWSQNSMSIGNNTYVNGRAANGNSWNATITPYGTFGTSSDGDSFYEPN